MHSAVTRALRSGWIPAAAVLLLASAHLLAYDTPALDLVKYGAYLLYGLVVPGTLIWRALRGTPRSLVEDVAAGTAVGYAIELGVYLAARAAGVPLAVALWPAVVIITFLAAPKLRQHWRPKYVESPPLWWGWTVAGVLGVVFAGTAVQFFRWHGLTWPWSSAPYYDIDYQLALAGELKNHVPPTTPYVLGEPLDYHWFVHAQMAASSWVTGTELQVILYRLFAWPMLAVFTVLIACIAKRISGQWWAGAVAAVMTFLVSALSPYQWTDSAFFDLSLLELNLWVSPTQTFAATLFAAVVLLLVGRLRREEPGARGEWVLIAILVAAVMGAKATFLPLLLGGLLLAFAVRLVFRRTLDRAALAGIGITVVAFLFASLVVFGGAAHALQLKPLQTVRYMPALFQPGVTAGYATNLPAWLTLFATGLALLAWGTRAAGLVGLLTRRERVLDPAVLLLAGVCVAGIVATLALRHPGVSQTYFLRSIAPYLAVLSACGLAALVPAERAHRRVAAALLGTVVAAGLVAWVVTRLDDPNPPAGGQRQVAIELLKPIALLFLVLALAAVALVAARRRYPALRGISAALILAAVIGLGLPPTIDRLTTLVRMAESNRRIIYVPDAGARTIPDGGMEAARWLRGHSGPNDLVATNVHCRKVNAGKCDNRHFWISGYSERRVLVEGWGYTSKVYRDAWSGKGAFMQLEYWDPERLAANDRAFAQPSKETIGRLRSEYDVRWLFIDERYDKPAGDLDDLATFKYRDGHAAVYELR